MNKIFNIQPFSFMLCLVPKKFKGKCKRKKTKKKSIMKKK